MGTRRDYLARYVRRLEERQEMIVRMIDQKPDLVAPLLKFHGQRCELPLRTAGTKTVNKTKQFHKESEDGKGKVES
jgi:hypothetical protein